MVLDCDTVAMDDAVTQMNVAVSTMNRQGCDYRENFFFAATWVAQILPVDHLDSSCSQQIAEIYRRLLPHDGRILDLMSSWVSHLPDAFSTASITGDVRGRVPDT